MTHIMSNTGMRGSSESITRKSLVLIRTLLVEMIFAEWNSCGSGGLGQSLGTDMGSRGQSCLKSVLSHLPTNMPLASLIQGMLSVLVI